MHEVSALPLDSLPVSYRADDPDRAFGIVAGTAAVRGRVGHGIDRAWIEDVRVIDTLRIAGSSSATAKITPVSIERFLDIGVTERLLVLPGVPAFICEWSSEDGAVLDLEWELDLSVRGSIGSTGVLEWKTDDRTITVQSSTTDRCAVFELSRPFESCNMERTDAGGVKIRMRCAVGPDAIRMHVFTRHDENTAAALRNASSLVKATAGSMKRRTSQQLRMTSSDSAMDAALERNKHHVALFPDRHTIPTVVMSALAVGEYGVAGRMIRNDDVTSPWFLFLLSRFHLWTGDDGFITSQSERAHRAVAFGTSRVYGGDPPAEIALRLAGLDGYASLARDMGNASAASEISSFLTRARATHADLLRDAHWLSALDPAARDVKLFTDGRVRDGVIRLERAAHASAIDPSALIAPLVFGLLGIEPDAARGRIRMRLQPPDMWDHIQLENLRFGDNALSISWSHDSRGNHTIRASQQDGAAPVRLILEPRLQAQRLLNATVDGKPATLDAIFTDGRLTTPVQLVLDDERVVTLQVDR